VNTSNVLKQLLSRRRLDQHVEQVVGAEADFVSGQPNDARIARAKHLDRGPAAQSELFEPVDVIGRADNLDDPGTMPGGKAPQRNSFNGGGVFHKSGSMAGAERTPEVQQVSNSTVLRFDPAGKGEPRRTPNLPRL
jgi:hypothetical protein